MKKFIISGITFLFVFVNVALAQHKYIDQSANDTTIRAADNFYEYANGNWLKTNDIPDDQSSWGNLTILDKQTKQKLQQLLISFASQKNAIGTDAQKLKSFYKSGMDTIAIEKLGIQPVKADLMRIYAINSQQGIMNEVINNYPIYTPMFDFDNLADPIKNEKEIAGFGQGGLGLPEKSYYFDNDEKAKKLRGKYVDYMSTLFELSGVSKSASHAKANSVLNLETHMAKGSRTATENRNIMRMLNFFTTEKLSARYPLIHFEDIFQQLNIQSEKILVAQPEFFDTLNSLLATQPLSTWKDYLTIKLLSASAPYLSSPFVRANFAFYATALSGKTKMRSRGEAITSAVDAKLGEILGKVYVEKYFTADAKKRIDDLVQNVLTTFGERIKANTWMTDSTKELALVKLSKIQRKIAYPDTWKDYTALKIGNNFYDNIKATSAFTFKQKMSKIGKPVDRNAWTMTPPTLNAYYNPLNNEIVFPAGILLPPFFDPNADDAVNYGGIATIIGHEISHGFDDQGSQFDGDGRFRNWWTKKDKENFKAKGAQLANQFDQFVAMDSLHVNGKLTLGENIADLCGVTVAYQAFKKTAEGQSNQLIDGLTPDQRFFLSCATIARLKQRDESARTQILTDPHSPAQFRVNDALSNLPAFYAAFGVREGDKMWRAPEDRVEIW
ncbi:MAG: M13 family metallopeptidase [Ginsengibacter sp.]